MYLIELPGKGQGFLLPSKWIPHVGRTSVAGVTALARAIARTL